jgi:hypothetical protein
VQRGAAPAVEQSRVSLADGHGKLEQAPTRRAQPQQEASPLLRRAPEPLWWCGEGRPLWRCPGGALRGAAFQTLFLLDCAHLVVYSAA